MNTPTRLAADHDVSEQAALAARGAAVLVTSQDLDELAEITDRIAVMFHGHLSEPLPTAEADREKLGLLMGGSSLEKKEAAHAAGA